MTLINDLEQAVGNEYLNKVNDELIQTEGNRNAYSNAIVSIFPHLQSNDSDKQD